MFVEPWFYDILRGFAAVGWLVVGFAFLCLVPQVKTKKRVMMEANLVVNSSISSRIKTLFSCCKFFEIDEQNFFSEKGLVMAALWPITSLVTVFVYLIMRGYLVPHFSSFPEN